MSASFSCVTAFSASVPLPRRRSLRQAQRLIECATCKAQRRRADGDAEQVERLHADAEALARLTDDRIGGHADIVVFQARQRVRCDDVDAFGDLNRICAVR